jgi:nucleoid-associated protein YgaU
MADPDKPDFSDVVSGSSSSASPPTSSAGPSGQAGGAAAGGAGTRSYVVQSGDSLSKIAKKFYGDANAWHRIFEANKDRIKNPDLIQPGWKLEIPE